MKHVIWLAFGDTPNGPGVYWDTTLLDSLLSKRCTYHEGNQIPEGITDAIVIIPGAYQGKYIAEINKELSKLRRCKVIITSDEQNNFPIDELRHDNMQIFATYLTDKYTSDIHWLPIGPARMPDVEYEPKTLDWFYAGQVNHESRRQLVEYLKLIQSTTTNDLITTDGFAQGLEQSEYYKRMSKAKVVPAPRGNISPDSFRFYEALELGAVPVPENKAFWDKLFHDHPFKPVDKWQDMPLSLSRAYRNTCVAWWQRKKLEIQEQLIGKPAITVVVPVSPIKSHPSTEILDETLESITHQLPDARIIVTFDGIRPEHEHRRDDYEQFIERALRKHNNKIYPMIFDEHTHQVGMLRASIKHCSKYILYVEQDTPFTTDYIDWQGCIADLKRVDLIRFHFEAQIPEPHKYLMMGKVQNSTVPLLRTKQYSQRPHITTKSFYEKVLLNFTPHAKSFIEDRMHSVAQQYPKEYRLAIYNPTGSIKRSYHTDGRAGEDKLDGTQIF